MSHLPHTGSAVQHVTAYEDTHCPISSRSAASVLSETGSSRFPVLRFSSAHAPAARCRAAFAAADGAAAPRFFHLAPLACGRLVQQLPVPDCVQSCAAAEIHCAHLLSRHRAAAHADRPQRAVLSDRHHGLLRQPFAPSAAQRSISFFVRSINFCPFAVSEGRVSDIGMAPFYKIQQV